MCKGFHIKNYYLFIYNYQFPILINYSNPWVCVWGGGSPIYLILFTKCTNLCNQINLYIKNDYPLIIKYTVASLGTIKLCLAPNTN